MNRINIVCLLLMLFGLPACVPATVDSAAGLIAITLDFSALGQVPLAEASFQIEPAVLELPHPIICVYPENLRPIIKVS
jgi:hypothetical protein